MNRALFECFRWILTAAHCLDGKNSITAYLGIDSSGHFRKSVRIPLENQFVSPEHDTKTDANDIGWYKNSLYKSTGFKE